MGYHDRNPGQPVFQSVCQLGFQLSDIEKRTAVLQLYSWSVSYLFSNRLSFRTQIKSVSIGDPNALHTAIDAVKVW